MVSVLAVDRVAELFGLIVVINKCHMWVEKTLYLNHEWNSFKCISGFLKNIIQFTLNCPT